MKPLALLCGVLILAFSFCNVYAFEKKDYVTYFGTTDKTIKASWDLVVGAVKYEVQIYCVDRKEAISLGNTTMPEKVIQIPRSGHYIVKVRAINLQNRASTWSESIDPKYATVDGEPRAWWVYGHIAAPGPIIIN